MKLADFLDCLSPQARDETYRAAFGLIHKCLNNSGTLSPGDYGDDIYISYYDSSSSGPDRYYRLGITTKVRESRSGRSISCQVTDVYEVSRVEYDIAKRTDDTITSG